MTFFAKLGSKTLTSSYSQLWVIFSGQKNVKLNVYLNRSYDSDIEK